MRNIITVCKKGTKRTRMYTAEHVQIMKNMIDRHCDYDQFVCITDQADTMPKGITVVEIPNIQQHSNWWAKIETFNPHLPVEGDCLYIDLDCVVVDNINCLWEYEQGNPVKLINVSDFYAERMGWKFNSSVYRYTVEDFEHIWWDYRSKWEHIQTDYFMGDEKYTSEMDKCSKMFPREWIINYEYVILQKGKHHMTSLKHTESHSEIPQQAKIIVFAGGHKPWRCEDLTIKEHYQ